MQSETVCVSCFYGIIKNTCEDLYKEDNTNFAFTKRLYESIHGQESDILLRGAVNNLPITMESRLLYSDWYIGYSNIDTFTPIYLAVLYSLKIHALNVKDEMMVKAKKKSIGTSISKLFGFGNTTTKQQPEQAHVPELEQASEQTPQSEQVQNDVLVDYEKTIKLFRLTNRLVSVIDACLRYFSTIVLPCMAFYLNNAMYNKEQLEPLSKKGYLNNYYRNFVEYDSKSSRYYIIDTDMFFSQDDSFNEGKTFISGRPGGSINKKTKRRRYVNKKSRHRLLL